tara:strand:+ start:921 stop:1247 length:327 start_codon:yes stop_codon:yes gene_type:complete
MADISQNANSGGYVASLVVKKTGGVLFGLTGYNSSGSAQFIQVHDANILPADAAVPVLTFTVATVANFSIDFGIKGRKFTKGIVVCNSSTGPTKTIGSADTFIDAQYS